MKNINNTKNSFEKYIDVDLLCGDDAELTCRSVNIRKARKEHLCFMSQGYDETHNIKYGEYYREERALVDGDFFNIYRVCFHCIDKELEYEDE